MKFLFTLLITGSLLSSYAQRNKVYHSFQEAFEQPDSVFQLDLSATGMKSLPEAVALFPNLEVLILTENSLENFPVFLCRMNKLRHLDLSHNYIQSIPKEIEQLNQLDFLSLSWNYTLDESLENIGALSSLKEMKLDGLKIDQLPKTFVDLRSLEVLDLSYNRFSELPKWLVKLPFLNRIHLGNNQFSKGEIDKVQKRFKERENFKLVF